MEGSPTISPERVEAVVEMLDTRISSLESYLESRPPFRDDPSEDIEV